MIEERFEDTLLIRRGDGSVGGGELPTVTTVGHHPADVTHTLAAVREQLGVNAMVLACRSVDVADGLVRRVLEIELLDDASTREVPPARESVGGRDWTLPGWWERAATWIAEQTHAAGLGQVHRLEQIRAWEFSCVLHVRTDAAELYFKALPHAYAHEPRLAQHLAEHHPAYVPEVVAIDASERWLLTRACRGQCLESGAPLRAWDRAAAAYAELQIEAMPHAETLRALGCPRRGPLELRALLGQLLEDDAALLGSAGQRLEDGPARLGSGRQLLEDGPARLGSGRRLLEDGPALVGPAGYALTADELHRLRQLRRDLEAACDELADSGLPLTLEHGDLWSSNVYVGERDVQFIDWTDARLSHPFFSLMPLLHSLEWDPQVRALPEIQEHLINQYLEPWTPFATRETLERAVALARPLAALHIANTYWRDTPRPHLQWWMSRMVPFFARMALQQFDLLSKR